MSVPQGVMARDRGLSEWCVLHGYPNSIDDKDTMAVCVPPLDYYYGLTEYGTRGTREIVVDPWDIVVYEARKMIRLLARGNPNVLALLWLPPNLYIKTTDRRDGRRTAPDAEPAARPHTPFVHYASQQLYKMEHGAHKGYMGEKRKRLVEQHGYDCYTDDTEFLTRDGWQTADQIADDATLAGVDRQSGRLVWQPILDRVYKPWEGRIFHHHGRHTDYAVTGNHRMLVSRAHRGKGGPRDYDETSARWEFVSAQDLVDSRWTCFHVRTTFAAQVGIAVDPSWLYLWGAMASEGCFAKYRANGTPRCVRIGQTDRGKA